jgi:hypothetical protein
MMRLAAIAALSLALQACAIAPTPSFCPVGQSEVRTAQLFLAARAPKKPSEKELTRFMQQEVTPRFPDGVTVVDGGAQWKGAENQMIRDAAKVVLLVLPPRDGHQRVEAVRTAYRVRFRQDSVVILPPPSCAVL